MPGKREYVYCLTDTTLVRKLKLGGECDKGVDISDREGAGIEEDVQNGEMSVQDTTEDEHEAEVEQPAHWPEPKTSRYQKTSKPLRGIDSKLPTDVRGQGAHEDTETKIAEEGKNTARKLFIISVRLTFKS